MITLAQIQEKLALEAAASPAGLDCEVAGGYASDLLSCVMHRARAGDVWVTLQSHVNVVAVASLLSLAAVIITEGQRPEPETLERAAREGVTLLLTPRATFEVVAELAALGVQGAPARD